MKWSGILALCSLARVLAVLTMAMFLVVSLVAYADARGALAAFRVGRLNSPGKGSHYVAVAKVMSRTFRSSGTRRCLSLVVAASLIFAPHTSLANLFRPDDATKLEELAKKLFAVDKDLAYVMKSLIESKSYNAERCIEYIHNDVLGAYFQIDNISTLIDISIGMISEDNEKSINVFHLENALKSSLSFLKNYREDVNRNAGYCGFSAIVVSRRKLRCLYLMRASISCWRSINESGTESGTICKSESAPRNE